MRRTISYYTSIMYWNFYRIDMFIGKLIAMPILWLNKFCATRIPFLRRIAEKRRKEEGFDSIEEWCEASSNVGMMCDAQYIPNMLLLFIYFCLTLGTCNYIVGGVLGLEVFRVLLLDYLDCPMWLVLAFFAMCMCLPPFGLKYVFFDSAPNKYEYYNQYRDLSRKERCRDMAVTFFCLVVCLCLFSCLIMLYKLNNK